MKGSRLIGGNLLNSLKDFASKLFGSKMIVDTGNAIQPILIGGPATYPDPNILRFIQTGYSANATVYTIVSVVARKFGSVPRYVYKTADQKSLRTYRDFIRQGKFTLRDIKNLERKAYEETTLDDTPFGELLARPNPWQGQDSFYELICTFYIIAGESFIYLNRGDIEGMDDDQADKEPPMEMYVLPSQYVELIPDPEDVWGIVGYYFNVSGQRIFMRENDVIHWRKPNPNFDANTRIHLRGFSPLNAGNKLVTQDEAATDAAVAMHQNDGAKGILFNKSMDSMDPIQKSQLESVIDRKVNNRSIKSAVAVIQGDWGYQDLSQSSVDMELVEGQQAIFVRTCNLLGVNPMLFVVDSTYENIQQARKDLVTSLVLPMCCSLRDEMNRGLLKGFGLTKQYTHDVDVAQLPELQNDAAAMITSLAPAWWLTPNQRLAAMNEEKSDDPNMDKVWMPTGMQLMEDAAMTDINNSFIDGPNTDQGVGGAKGSGLPGGGPAKGDKTGLPGATPAKGK